MLEVAEPRLFDNRTPEDVIEDAGENYGPFKETVCMFSGGNDSLAVAHRCREHYDMLVWVDTGTAVPGVREFVEEMAVWLKKPLRIYAPPAGQYERIVLGGVKPSGVTCKPNGFPGPAMHPRCYRDLKERAIEAMRRDLKGGDRKARVLALSGIRRAESKRRAFRRDVTKNGALIWCNPIIDWTSRDLLAYRREHDLPQSDVAALIHRSGECNCGAFARRGEREELKLWFPDWFAQTIEPLEEAARAAGLKHSLWGARWAEEGEPGHTGPMCSDCQLRLEDGQQEEES